MAEKNTCRLIKLEGLEKWARRAALTCAGGALISVLGLVYNTSGFLNNKDNLEAREAYSKNMVVSTYFIGAFFVPSLLSAAYLSFKQIQREKRDNSDE